MSKTRCAQLAWCWGRNHAIALGEFAGVICLFQAETHVGIVPELGGHVVDWYVGQCGNLLGDERHIRRLIAGATVRVGRKIRAICLDQKPLEGQVRDNLVHLTIIAKGNRAAE